MERASALSATLKKHTLAPGAAIHARPGYGRHRERRGTRRRAVPMPVGGALAVVDNERSVGMLEQVRFLEALMRRIDGAGT
jgi:hypothetical protein